MLTLAGTVIRQQRLKFPWFFEKRVWNLRISSWTIAAVWAIKATLTKNVPCSSKSLPIYLPHPPVCSLAKTRSISAVHYKQMNPLSPKKLLLSKWTAVQPIAKQKHFLVSKVILPEPPNEKIEFVEIEAVFTKKVSLIAWRDLTNSALWIQGWQ